MKNKMIRDFPTLFTHTTPIYHDNVTLAEIIQSENFLREAVQAKKTNLKGALILQMLFQGKEEP